MIDDGLSFDPNRRRRLLTLRIGFASVGAILCAYSLTILYYHFHGDMDVSCRDASEIDVDGDGNLYCGVPLDQSVRVFSPHGHYQRSISIDGLQGGFAITANKTNGIEVLVFRTATLVTFDSDGQLVSKTLGIRDYSRLAAYPKVETTGVNGTYALRDGEVYLQHGETSTIVVASHTPSIVPPFRFVAILVMIGGVGALFASVVADEEWLASIRRLVLARYSWRWFSGRKS